MFCFIRIAIKAHAHAVAFVRFFRRSRLNTYTIGSTFFFTDIGHVSLIQYAFQDIQAKIVVNACFHLFRETGDYSCFRSGQIQFNNFFSSSFRSSHFVIHPIFFPVVRFYRSQVFFNQWFYGFCINVTHDEECKVADVFDTVAVDLLDLFNTDFI